MKNKKSVHLEYELRGASKKLTHEYRVNAILREVNNICRNIENPKILDIGCGRGELLKLLADKLGADVYGIDIDDECIKMSSKYGKIWRGTVKEVGDKFGLDREFDVVISSHSMEHMGCPLEQIKSAKQMCKAYLIVAVPNPHKLFNIIRVAIFQRIPPVNSGHLYCWDAPHLKVFLESHCGFVVTNWFGDLVKVIPKGYLREQVIKTKFYRKFEGVWLPKVFPRLSNSLIVTCKIN